MLLSSCFSRPSKVGLLWALGHDAAPERGFGQGATNRARGTRKGMGRKWVHYVGEPFLGGGQRPPAGPPPGLWESAPTCLPGVLGEAAVLGDRSSSAPPSISPGGTWRLPLRLASEHRAVAVTSQAVRERRCSTSGGLDGTNVVPAAPTARRSALLTCTMPSAREEEGVGVQSESVCDEAGPHPQLGEP